MWSTERPESDPILLLEPASSKSSKSRTDPAASYIGGTPSFFPNDDVSPPRPLCAICNEEMHLIIQMYAPLDGMDRSLLVFGCNTASCVTQAFQVQGSNSTNNSNRNVTGENFRFCLGGNGVFKCIRSQRKQEQEQQHKREKAAVQEQKMVSTWDDDNGGWGDADDDDDDDAGWGGDTGDDTDWGASEQQDGIENNPKSSSSMDELEAMLAVMEAKDKDEAHSKNREIKSPQQKYNPSNTTRQQNKSEGDQVASNAFPKYDLDVYDEPYISTADVDSDDEDIQDTTNDKDIQHLLSKYLEEEDDSEILSAIKGGKSAAGGIGSGGGIGGEQYERLPPEERAFFTFTSRVKRAPKQSARYAYGGVPLWSIPTPLTTPKGKKGGQSRDLKFPRIPPCSCGAPREFECQVMPSILHVIGVDKFIKETSVGPNTCIDIEKILSKSNGGMNWGTIAVYSCASSCNTNREEFVIVQESADGDPKKREMKPDEGANSGDHEE